MALQQKLEDWDLNLHQINAIEKYPNDDPSIALENYTREHFIEGIFFLNDAKERCIWGPSELANIF